MSDPFPKPPSVLDVAQRAGVAKATAARVLGHYGTVSAKTRAAVEAAAAELGYRPNELARSMTTGRSGTIGVVIGDIGNPFFGVAVRSIGDVLRGSGSDMLLANSGESVESEQRAIRMLLSRQVDGLIVSPSDLTQTEHLRQILPTGIPLVLLDRAVPGLAVDSVTADDRDVARELSRMLIAEGHRRIAYFTACGTPGEVFCGIEQIATGSVRERIAGFHAAGQEAGLQPSDLRVAMGAKYPGEIRTLLHSLLSLAQPPTGLIASDSVIGLELYREACAMGHKIPDDLSLVSFHDADWASVAPPGITVVRQPAHQLGALAAERVLLRIAGDERPSEALTVPSEIVLRGSVGSAG